MASSVATSGVSACVPISKLSRLPLVNTPVENIRLVIGASVRTPKKPDAPLPAWPGG
jgi:hypothetical protein